MDISSGAGYPASSLSNFAPHKFIIDDVKCASMEGFLQSLKFQNPDMQRYVCSLVGKAAKFKGKNKKWQKTGNLYWQGKVIKRNCICEDSKFINANFLYAKLINSTFKLCDCKNADFQSSKMDSVCFDRSNLENASFMYSIITELTLDKTITYNIAFTNISLNAKSDSNTDCKNDYDTDVKSTKANIYNTVQKILKDSGFETNDTKAKINMKPC